MIGLWRRESPLWKLAWAKKLKGVGLPEEYQRVEYLQSSGAQYIDTGVSGGDYATKPSYSIRFAPLAGGSQYKQYLAGDKAPKAVAKIYSASRAELLALQVGSGNYTEPDAEPGAVYTIHSTLEQTTVNGADSGLPAGDGSNGWGTLSWWVFGSHSETSLKAYMRLYSLKMWEDGHLVRNYTPCIRKADSKPGLFETVSGEFVVNAGTGEFTTP